MRRWRRFVVGMGKTDLVRMLGARAESEAVVCGVGYAYTEVIPHTCIIHIVPSSFSFGLHSAMPDADVAAEAAARAAYAQIRQRNYYVHKV